MQTINPNYLSYSTLPISMKLKETDTELFTGTSFFYRYNNKLYLITNWHIITGLNPKDKTPISSHGGVPDQMLIPFLVNLHPVRYEYYPIDIYENGDADWLIHPIYKEKVDVIAIEVELYEDFPGIIKPINEYNFDDFNHEIGDDVFILGYPYKFTGGGNFPIWKRGSIASEPEINYENLPKFFVDTATKPGMSGAPVIFRRIGVHNKNNEEIFTPETRIGEIRNFIGVYSGRVIGENDIDAQLGIVWKKEVIEEIIIGNLKDSLKFL